MSLVRLKYMSEVLYLHNHYDTLSLGSRTPPTELRRGLLFAAAIAVVIPSTRDALHVRMHVNTPLFFVHDQATYVSNKVVELVLLRSFSCLKRVTQLKMHNP